MSSFSATNINSDSVIKRRVQTHKIVLEYFRKEKAVLVEKIMTLNSNNWFTYRYSRLESFAWN